LRRASGFGPTALIIAVRVLIIAVRVLIIAVRVLIIAVRVLRAPYTHRGCAAQCS